MKRLGRRRWVILIAFLLAASFAGLFAARTARHALYWSRHRDEAIRPWMSVPYVTHSYRVPPRTEQDDAPPRGTLRPRRRIDSPLSRLPITASVPRAAEPKV